MRVIWFGAVTCALSYGTFLVVGSIIEAQAFSATAPIMVRDQLSPGIHHLSGMVMVPSSCDQLSVATNPISTTTFELVFQTWQDPAVACSSDEMPRAFRAVLFAPAAGIDFLASLDGANLPIVVLPTIPQN